LFFPTVWRNKSNFSPRKEPFIIAYSGDIEDIEYENPTALFAKYD